MSSPTSRQNWTWFCSVQPIRTDFFSRVPCEPSLSRISWTSEMHNTQKCSLRVCKVLHLMWHWIWFILQMLSCCHSKVLHWWHISTCGSHIRFWTLTAVVFHHILSKWFLFMVWSTLAPGSMLLHPKFFHLYLYLPGYLLCMCLTVPEVPYLVLSVPEHISVGALKVPCSVRCRRGDKWWNRKIWAFCRAAVQASSSSFSLFTYLINK